MKLMIAGLSNPGEKYDGTRHNLGAYLVCRLAKRFGVEMRLNDDLGCYLGMSAIGRFSIHLVAPNCYVNVSGELMRLTLDHLDVASQNLMVAHDEVNLPPGYIRLSIPGKKDRHNGLRSVLNSLGTNSWFYKLSVGVGRPEVGLRLSDFVLGRPNPDESGKINCAIEMFIDRLERIMTAEDRQVNLFDLLRGLGSVES